MANRRTGCFPAEVLGKLLRARWGAVCGAAGIVADPPWMRAG